MSSFTLQFDDSFLDETVKKQLEAVKSGAFLNRIGEYLKNKTVQHFDDQRDPFGRPWIQSLAAIRESRKTLIKTGNLYGSFQYSVSGNVLTVGTNVDYAAFHQTGTSKFPARPFLGISDQDKSQIERVIVEFIEDVIHGRA